jgi:hypothetical protein
MTAADIVVSIFIVLVIIVLVCSVKNIRTPILSSDEILRFFADYEKLTATELSRRIELRTDGTQQLPDAVLYAFLQELVRAGKLVQEEIHSDGGAGLTIVRYSLLEQA